MAGFAEEFADITKRNESLAPFTFLKVGGPAEFLVQPRTRAQLAAVVRRCFRESIPMRVLGTGCNLLVRDEGVSGVVLRLVEPEFTSIHVDGQRVRAGTGAAVSALISESARHGLAGLEGIDWVRGDLRHPLSERYPPDDPGPGYYTAEPWGSDRGPCIDDRVAFTPARSLKGWISEYPVVSRSSPVHRPALGMRPRRLSPPTAPRS